MAKAREIKNGNGNSMEINKPYYCTECKRNHTKGKIYKEHLKFANSEDNNEELINGENAESEFENADPEFENYDDDAEIIEAFNELEEEINSDVENFSNNDNDINNCVEAVKNLPGVGEATLNKLIKAGFNSLESIAFTPPSIIQEESGLGEKTTTKLIKVSMEKLNIGFKSAVDVWEHRKNIARVTTGSQELDDVLGGGVETGSVIEFYGEFRTGKTQIMHQLCVNVQLPREKGGLEGNALYIDTE